MRSSTKSTTKITNEPPARHTHYSYNTNTNNQLYIGGDDFNTSIIPRPGDQLGVHRDPARFSIRWFRLETSRIVEPVIGKDRRG